MIPAYVVATSEEAARMRSLEGIAVIYPYSPEGANYWIADAWADGKALYSYVGAVTMADAIEHATGYLRGMARENSNG
jgi:hypothetical protein